MTRRSVAQSRLVSGKSSVKRADGAKRPEAPRRSGRQIRNNRIEQRHARVDHPDAPARVLFDESLGGDIVAGLLGGGARRRVSVETQNVKPRFRISLSAAR